MMNDGNRIVINTGLDSFVLIDKITEAAAGNIGGIKNFVAAPIYLGLESLAQLGAYHVRFLTRFERHAFLLKITSCTMPAQEVIDGRYFLYGTLISRSESAFTYKLQAKKESNSPLPNFNKGQNPPIPPLLKGGEGGLLDETHIEGEFLYATVDYNSTFKREILQNHYRKVFSCLQNDIKTD